MTNPVEVTDTAPHDPVAELATWYLRVLHLDPACGPAAVAQAHQCFCAWVDPPCIVH